MLDFRIMVGAIVVCISFVVIGARLLLSSDTLSVALGERPDLRTAAAPREPVAQPHVEAPLIPPVTLPRTTASTRRTAAPVSPREAAVAGRAHGDVTGSIEPADAATAEAAAEARPPDRPAPRRRASAQRPEPDSLSPVLMFFYKHSIAK